MSGLDWLLFGAFLCYVIWDGARRARDSHTSEDFLLAGRHAPWWVIGLSIMATQASAVTLVSTTGKGWETGLEFAQFYFGLPLAMAILAVTLLPVYSRLKVYTAYEYLGNRFDRKTRLTAAALFLALRGLSVGVILLAPSVVLSLMFGIDTVVGVIVIGVAAALYTTLGGMRAVLATDVKQMTVMTVGTIVAFVVLLSRVGDEYGLEGAWRLAASTEHLTAIRWEWDPAKKYTIGSALVGGTLLFLAYFGTDQSQVQRTLAGRSLRHGQGALALNAALKIPFQFLILGTGVLLFLFYTVETPPLSFVPGVGETLPPAQLEEFRGEHERRATRVKDAAIDLATRSEVGGAADPSRVEFVEAVRALRTHRDEFRAATDSAPQPEVNFAFPHFVYTALPAGIAGLLFAAILAAALSSVDSELNALPTVTVRDFYLFAAGHERSEADLLRTARVATLVWGALATLFALFVSEGALIERVNEIGSYFYGSLLGAFILAAIPIANGHGAFCGLLAGMVAVGAIQNSGINDGNGLPFLYLNTVGTATSVTVGAVVSLLRQVPRRGASLPS